MRTCHLGVLFVCALCCYGCSTTKNLPEGASRLTSNKVEIVGKAKVSESDLSSYIKQQPDKGFIFGWSPMVGVYNWSNGTGSKIDRLWEKIGVAPVVFDPMLVKSSEDNIVTHLESLGYYGSSVKTVVSEKDKLAKVTYTVSPGKRYQMDTIIYDLPSGEFASEFLADSSSFTLRQGDFISEKALEAESVRSAAYMRDLGYYSFNKNNYFFEADTLGPRTVLYYRIKGHTRNESALNDAPILKYRVGEVNIYHPADIPFRESLLRKFNTIRPGTVFSDKTVNTTYSRLSSIKVFNSVNIEMNPADSAKVNYDIRLSGANPKGFKTNFEASSNSSGLIGVSPQISFYHNNVFHGGEQLTLGFTGNWQFKPGSDVRSTELGLSTGLLFPKFLGYPLYKIKGANIPSTEMKVSFNYQNRPEYRRSIASLSYGYTGQVRTKAYYQFYPLQLNLVKLFNISEDFGQSLEENPYLWDSFHDHIDLGASGTLYFTSNPDIVPKTSYRFLRLSADLSGNILSLFNSILPFDDATGKHRLLGLPYNQFVKAEISAGNVFRFGRSDGQAIAVRLLAGAGRAYGNSNSLPFEKQFYCGGAGGMRGWQARSLGPGFDKTSTFFSIPSQTGDLKFEADVEYRFNMFWKLEGALFAEAGNVWNSRDDNDFISSLAADWGLGLRVNLNFILLRLDAGFKVHDPSRDAGSRWLTPDLWFQKDGCSIHFGVGYPF